MTAEECNKKADYYDGEAVRLMSIGDLAGAKAMRQIAASYRADAEAIKAK